MSTFFISDLHLSQSRPETTDLFLNFLKQEASDAEALYILGDFFEVWLGDDILKQNSHDNRIITALADYTKTGIPVYFMHGNRDFLIGPQFAKMSGCKILPDPFSLELYGQKVVLTHGDLLCTLDQSYQRFRRFVRHPIIKKIFLSLPLSLRCNIANRIRAKSRQQFKINSPSHPKYDVTLDAVQEILRQYNAELLIHGHTHRPGIHTVSVDGHVAKRIVLGEWLKTGSMLELSASRFELKQITPTQWEPGFFDFEAIKDYPDFSQYRHEFKNPSEDPLQ